MRHQGNLNGWQWASGNLWLQPGTWLPRTNGLAENRLGSGRDNLKRIQIVSGRSDRMSRGGRDETRGAGWRGWRWVSGNAGTGQRRASLRRNGRRRERAVWYKDPRSAGWSERRAGSGLGSGREKLETHVVNVGSVRQERAGAACDNTGGAGWRGWRQPGGGSAATRGPDGGWPRCDGMAAVGSRGHAQAVPQFSMPVSCRGQLLAGGQTASECSDGKRDRHGPRPDRDREWVGPLAAGGRKRGPGGSYHCSGMDAAGVVAVCQPSGSQRD